MGTSSNWVLISQCVNHLSSLPHHLPLTFRLSPFTSHLSHTSHLTLPHFTSALTRHPFCSTKVYLYATVNTPLLPLNIALPCINNIKIDNINIDNVSSSASPFPHQLCKKEDLCSMSKHLPNNATFFNIIIAPLC